MKAYVLHSEDIKELCHVTIITDSGWIAKIISGDKTKMSLIVKDTFIKLMNVRYSQNAKTDEDTINGVR